MNTFKNLGIAFMFLAVLGCLSSCDDDDVVSTAIIGPGTVYTKITKSGSLTSLEAALIAAQGDLPGTLAGSGPFTVFAPSDAAFETFAKTVGFNDTVDGEGTVTSTAAQNLLGAVDPGLLAQILTYHVVPGNLEASSLSDGTTLTTVLGDEITVVVTADGDVELVGLLDATKLPETNPVSTVLQANGFADNGIVHLIDRVLVPQAAIDALTYDIRPTVAERATGTENLSSLAAALDKAGLVDAIVELDTARVLAPNNQAFEDLLNTLGPDYTAIDDFDNDAEIAVLKEILLYHVLPPVDQSVTLIGGSRTTLLEGNNINVNPAGSSFTIGDVTATNAQIVTANIDARNGAVDIIDKVLLPKAAIDFIALLGSDDLATTVIGAPSLSILEEALIATDLVGAFVDNTNQPDPMATNFTYFRPATVFAPTNEAFTNLLNALGPDYTNIASFDTKKELALLTDILLYHVIAGKIGRADLENGTVTTASEKDLEIISVVGTDNFVVGDATNDVNANITVPDIFARNGVAHFIDKVLLPQSAIDFINSMK